MADLASTMQKNITKWRADLLDQTLANPLLNLITNRRSMQQVHADKSLIQQLIQPKNNVSISLTAELLVIADERSDKTKELAARKRLTKLRSSMRGHLNQRGVHTLYLTYGLLEWYESASSDKRLTAPLLLIPVELKANDDWAVAAKFTLSRKDNEVVQFNQVLQQRFKSDFNVEWGDLIPPDITDEDNDTTQDVEEYLLQLQERIATRIPDQRFNIETSCYLSLFTFQRHALYEDLGRYEELVINHPLVQAICGFEAPPSVPTTPTDQLDNIPLKDVWQVLDADGSQQEAINAAKSGESFILQGPPGTGKSQTIANIIAECLIAQKSVLFVSEKSAAIEVVAKRLDNVGLASFCLNLHSTHQNNTKHVYNSLRKMMNKAQEPPSQYSSINWERTANELNHNRQKLNGHEYELHQSRSPLGLSVYRIRGDLASLHSSPDIRCALPIVATITQQELDDLCRDIESFGQYLDQFIVRTVNPWRDTPLRNYTSSLQGAITGLFQDMASHMSIINEHATILQQHLGTSYSMHTETSTVDLLHLTEFALTSPLPPESWFDPYQLGQRLSLIIMAQEQAGAMKNARDSLLKSYRQTALGLPATTMLPEITEGFNQLKTISVLDGNRIINDQTRLRPLLTEALQHIQDITILTQRMATVLAIEVPSSSAAITSVLTIADLLLHAPELPTDWRSPSFAKEYKQRVTKVRKRYQKVKELKEQLQKQYNDVVYTIDLASAITDLKQNFQTPFRWLNPSWYQLRSQLQQCLQTGTQMPSILQLIADLTNAEEVLRDKTALAVEFDEDELYYGNDFKGEATNWSTIEEQINWIEAFHREIDLEGISITPAITSFVENKQRRNRDNLEVAFKQLNNVWNEWLQISTLVETTILKDNGQIFTREEYQFQWLQETITTVLAACETVWANTHQLAVHTLPGVRRQWEQQRTDLEQIIAFQSASTWFEEQQQVLTQLLGDAYARPEAPWQLAQTQIEWCLAAEQQWHNEMIPAAFISTVADANILLICREPYNIIVSNQQNVSSLWQEAKQFIPIEHFAQPNLLLSQTAYADINTALLQQIEALPSLERWLSFTQFERQCKEHELNPFLENIQQLLASNRLTVDEDENRNEQQVKHIFLKRFYREWLTYWSGDIETLLLNGKDLIRTVASFQKHDKDFIHYTASRVSATMANHQKILVETIADSHRITQVRPLASSFHTLRHQLSLRRTKSLRKLIELTGVATQQFMPCWMMSPLSVSEFINPHQLQFDVVIFDEASQICVEDAISSIIRGKQLIVAGDLKQLPPTTIFRKMQLDEANEDDDDDENSNEAIESAESILQKCAGANFKSRSLRFHYRSQHESLIAFSNKHFYDNHLITFPSPANDDNHGLHWVYVEDGLFDTGRSRTNRREAQTVVDMLIAHAQGDISSTQSLGVITFSVAQKEAIEDGLRQALEAFPQLKAWFDEDKADGFFVRNLENVQGDERDVIIIDVGYAKSVDGKLRQIFGQLTRDGGERRLNVAITRGRQKIMVVTSIHGDEITGTSPGAIALRGYLNYAEHGRSALFTEVGDIDNEPRFDSPFEEEVYAALSSHGLNLHTQVGCSGYRIDMAVRDNRNPDRYLLGIECDGATYHSAKTARDRDRIRQQHLESLGWKFHRIWSTDWISDRETQITKILAEVQQLQTTVVIS